MKILFVCTGNSCRSVAAEKLFLAEGLPKTEARSRGIAAQPYGIMSAPVRNYLERKGIKNLSHKPAFATEADIEWADIILAMEPIHCDILAERFPQSARKTHLFIQYCAEKNEALEDPIGKSDAVYERILNQISFCIKALAEKIKAKQEYGI